VKIFYGYKTLISVLISHFFELIDVQRCGTQFYIYVSVVEATIRSDFSYALPRVNFLISEEPRTVNPLQTYTQTLTRGNKTCDRFSLAFVVSA
jgi:hypothetical protein